MKNFTLFFVLGVMVSVCHSSKAFASHLDKEEFGNFPEALQKGAHFPPKGTDHRGEKTQNSRSSTGPNTPKSDPFYPSLDVIGEGLRTGGTDGSWESICN